MKVHQGNALAEYGIILALLACVSIIPLTALGDTILSALAEIGQQVASKNSLPTKRSPGAQDIYSAVEHSLANTQSSQLPGIYDPAEYSTQAISEKVSIAGASGGIEQAAEGLRALAEALAKLDPKDPNVDSILLLAKQGFDLANTVKTSEKSMTGQHTATALSGDENFGWDDYQNYKSLASNRYSQPVEDQFQYFNAQRSQTLEALLDNPAVQQYVASLATDIANVTNAYVNESQLFHSEMVLNLGEEIELGDTDPTWQNSFDSKMESRYQAFRNSVSSTLIDQDSSEIAKQSPSSQQ